MGFAKAAGQGASVYAQPTRGLGVVPSDASEHEAHVAQLNVVQWEPTIRRVL